MVRTSRGRWGVDEIGDLTGSVMVVTGANSGIGYEAAVELAAHGAHVVLACRDPAKAAEAADRIVGVAPAASVESLRLDLADQAAVRAAAAEFAGRHDRLDVLVNNAGVMATPPRVTADGLELQWATNHFGPFALTGLVLDRLLTTPGSRVVTVSSSFHRLGHLDPARLDPAAVTTRRWARYGATKLANLSFTFELDRRLRQAGAPTIAVAAHPGWARSSLIANGPGMGATGLQGRVLRWGQHFGQSTAAGALPLLYAATADGVTGGDFIGPGGLAGAFGPPVRASAARAARSAVDAAELWRISEFRTGVHYEFGVAASH